MLFAPHMHLEDRELALYVRGTYIRSVASLRFEWDSRKAAANLHKHGVSFAEAETAFYDDFAVIRDDPDHSDEEDRFLLLGMSTASASWWSCTASVRRDRSSG